MQLDHYSRALLQGAHRNPAPTSRTWPSVRNLPWRAERAVRLAWVRAYLDALEFTGEVSEARWERAARAEDRVAFEATWGRKASQRESQDALREARQASHGEDPHMLGATLSVNWRGITNEALRRWWNTEEDAGELLWYAASRISQQALVLLATACARTTLRYVPEGEERPRIAIETAEAWARGEATLQQVLDAANDAYMAATGAYTYAYSIARAARAAYDATQVGVNTDAAPSHAAWSTAYAAEAAAQNAAPNDPEAWDAAFRRVLRELADLVRSMQSFPEW